MAKRGFDLLLVRKSGPVRSVSLGGFWAYVIILALVLVLGLLAGEGYLLHRQSAVVADMAEDTKLLMLRAERLESLVQEQETRDILTQQSEERPLPPAKGRGKPAPQAAQPAQAAEETGEGGQPATEAPPGNEPQSSDRLSIANVDYKIEGGDLVVSFDLNNEREPRDPAVGFITVVARGQRQGRPWVEAWPPMRLTPQGRPQNFHAGTPFSVQRFRRVRAKVASLEDKKFDLLEFVVYSRQGNLIMVKPYPLANAKDASRGR